MTDYLGSQAWQDELIDLLRTSATPPTVAVIAGYDQGLTDEEIAESWGELGGRRERCSVMNVKMRWIDIQARLMVWCRRRRDPRAKPTTSLSHSCRRCTVRTRVRSFCGLARTITGGCVR